MTPEQNRPDALTRIARETGIEDVVRLLAEDISGADLNTLLLEVFREKTRQSTPADLLHRYESNRFVRPAAVDALALRRLELDTLNISASHRFTPVQLSPVAPYGSCSIVATADQNKVISALRGTEAVSDATNLLALHCCHRIRAERGRQERETLRFSTTHRHVRAQNFGGAPGMLPHFHLFCAVTAGKDGGSYSFENTAFSEHIGLYSDIFRQLFDSEIQVRISARSGYTDAGGLVESLLRNANNRKIDARLTVGAPDDSNSYYKGVQFTILTVVGGQELAIGDGGFVDWPQQMLGSRKERMLISAFGLDRLLP